MSELKGAIRVRAGECKACFLKKILKFCRHDLFICWIECVIIQRKKAFPLKFKCRFSHFPTLENI